MGKSIWGKDKRKKNLDKKIKDVNLTLLYRKFKIKSSIDVYILQLLNGYILKILVIFYVHVKNQKTVGLFYFM